MKYLVTVMVTAALAVFGSNPAQACKNERHNKDHGKYRTPIDLKLGDGLCNGVIAVLEHEAMDSEEVQAVTKGVRELLDTVDSETADLSTIKAAQAAAVVKDVTRSVSAVKEVLVQPEVLQASLDEQVAMKQSAEAIVLSLTDVQKNVMTAGDAKLASVTRAAALRDAKNSIELLDPEVAKIERALAAGRIRPWSAACAALAQVTKAADELASKVEEVKNTAAKAEALVSEVSKKVEETGARAAQAAQQVMELTKKSEAQFTSFDNMITDMSKKADYYLTQIADEMKKGQSYFDGQFKGIFAQIDEQGKNVAEGFAGFRDAFVKYDARISGIEQRQASFVSFDKFSELEGRLAKIESNNNCGCDKEKKAKHEGRPDKVFICRKQGERHELIEIAIADLRDHRRSDDFMAKARLADINDGKCDFVASCDQLLEERVSLDKADEILRRMELKDPLLAKASTLALKADSLEMAESAMVIDENLVALPYAAKAISEQKTVEMLAADPAVRELVKAASEPVDAARLAVAAVRGSKQIIAVAHRNSEPRIIDQCTQRIPAEEASKLAEAIKAAPAEDIALAAALKDQLVKAEAVATLAK